MKIKNYLRAIWLWADLWDVCFWRDNENWHIEHDYYISCKTAWEIAHLIWLED